MATSSGADAPSTTSPSKPVTSETMPSSSPVEMSDLTSAAAADEASESRNQEDATAGAEQHQHREPEQEQGQQEAAPTASTPTPSAPSIPTQSTELRESPSPPRPAPAARRATEALGPATDAPIAAPPPSTSASGPTLSITLMLTTGARHPYKIDERYLKNRKVEAKGGDGNFDPREITAYKLKELIWTDWRPEWEPRPASPSSIRLIILGRLMEDNSSLKDLPFKLDDTNTVHMTVKPADFLDDDDTGGKKGHSMRGADGEESNAGCCRCVIL